MLIIFDDSLLTGITDIDIQHKLLYDAVNKLADIKNNEENLKFIIADIHEYATFHFKTEEEYMIKFNYPDIQEHIGEHTFFSQKYNALIVEIEENDISDEFLINLRIFLVDWIRSHYKDIDLKMVEFLKNALKNSN